MPVPDPRSALSRIVAAHRGAGTDQGALDLALQTGLTRAIRRASLPFATLAPDVAEIRVTGDAMLHDALSALPEHGLIAAIEDEEGRRGLLALDHPLVDALIEVQATGHVEQTDQPPRKITRIDEALCRDFVDLMLGAFAQETAEVEARDWPDRMQYGSHIAERAQLNLLMPERGYRLLQTSVTMGGRKTGSMAMVLPCDQALARRRAQAAPTTQAPVDWSAQMLASLSAAPMILDAVLMRVTLPLGKVEALGEGDLVPFDHSDLSDVTLEDEAGHVFARGGLGQLSGKRAVRFGGPVAASYTAAAPAPQKARANATGAPGMAAATAPAIPEMPAAGIADVPMAPPESVPDPMPMAGFDPDAPMGDFDPNAPMGDFDPNMAMGDFDPNAAIG